MPIVNYQQDSDSTPALGTFPLPAIAAVAGNLLVVHIQYQAVVQRTFVCAGGSLTWTRDTDASFFNADDLWGGETWYAVAANTTNVTATVTNSLQGTSYIAGAIIQYDSYQSWIGAVVNRQASPGTGANAVTTGNLNITGTPARQVAVFVNLVNAQPPTPSAGLTTRIADFSEDYGVIADRLIESIGNSAATATAQSGQGSVVHRSVQFAFAESGGGGEQEVDGEGDFALEIDVSQTGQGQSAARKLRLTEANQLELRSETGVLITASGVDFEWYDKHGNTTGEPDVTGSFDVVDGEAVVPLFGSALDEGQPGTLILYHPSINTVNGLYRLLVE